MIRKIGHSKISFNNVQFARGRNGKFWGWASNGERKAIIELAEAVWASSNGPIPSGASLVYLDGDSGNCKLENLGLSTDKEKKPAKKAKAKKASK